MTEDERTATGPPPRVDAAIAEPRFPPGAILAERYRIVARLGAGGMAEVYSADDLALGQRVALKFLPARLSSDPVWLARLAREVRIAREVTHPNICRVFDLVEAESATFLSMELVGGETLTSLLRRIGRPTEAKGRQIAEQLCIGLAAAHARGVLHHDLKPANVMLDERGHVKVTDFGIAELTTDAALREHKSTSMGTPAYMAPEQWIGRDMSVRTDLYALGLVLYEVFTGKRAFTAGSAFGYAELHAETMPARPAELAPGLDPRIDAVIWACLQKEPLRRPPSALHVLQALGGDAIAEELAQDRTPAPDLLVAAGGKAEIAPRTAVALFAASIALLALVVHIASRTSPLLAASLSKHPEVLVDRARTILASAGLTRPPRDTAFSFAFLPEERAAGPSSRGRVAFWYRQSPGYLMPIEVLPGAVTRDDPPNVAPGMVSVVLDTEGRLLRLVALPEPDDVGGAPGEAPWAALLAHAGLDPAQLEPTAPTALLPISGDQRAAWIEREAQGGGPPRRVEAAAYRNRPVYFAIEGAVTPLPELGTGDRAFGGATGAMLFVACFTGGAWLALRNFRAGRVDVRAARRFALINFTTMFARLLLECAHVPVLYHEVGRVYLAAGIPLVTALMMWIAYAAVEPYLRKTSPDVLFAWTRIVRGRIASPLVGRDLLLGAAGGVAVALLAQLEALVALSHGTPHPAGPFFMRWQLVMLVGGRYVLGPLLDCIGFSLRVGFLTCMLFVSLRAALRRPWLGAAVFVAMGVLPMALASPRPLESLVLWTGGYLIIALILLRLGVFALMVGTFSYALLTWFPITADLSAFYGGISLVVVGLQLAVLTAGLALCLRAREPDRRFGGDGSGARTVP